MYGGDYMNNKKLIDYILLNGITTHFYFDKNEINEGGKEEKLFKYYKQLDLELRKNRKTGSFETYDLEREIIKQTMEHEDIRQGEAIRHLIRAGYLSLCGLDHTDGFMRINDLEIKFEKKR